MFAYNNVPLFVCLDQGSALKTNAYSGQIASVDYI